MHRIASVCRGAGRAKGWFFAVAASLLFGPAALAAQEQPVRPTAPPHFAITNARIVTGAGRTIENGTVLVRDGIIQAVGRRVEVPAAAWRMDGSGTTVYPGLVDAFTTLGHPTQRGSGQEPEHSWGPEDRPGTFTWRSAADELSVDDERLEAWRNAGFTTALATLERGFFPGRAAVISLAGERGRSMVIEPAVAQRFHLSARDVEGFPNSLLGSLAYAKQLYLDAAHYDRVWQAYEAEPRGRVRPEYDRALEPLRTPRPVLFPAQDRTGIDRALRVTEVMGVPPIIYGGQAAYQAPDLLAEAGVPVLVNVDWPGPSRDGDPEAEPELEQLRLWDRAPTTPSVLAEAGVQFAFYSGDASADQVRDRVRKAMRYGLSADAALRALTLTPAEIFGVADRLGSVEEGKIANLVVTDGDLFDTGTTILRVFVDGREYPTEQAVAGGGREGADREEDAVGGPPVPMAQDDGPYRDDPVTLIRNATVMTVTNGTLERADVLIRDGKIAEVGQSLDAPRGATVVDATGMYVTPGVIDPHSHTAAASINEGAVAVSAMVTIEDVLDPEDESLYRALAGGVTTIHTMHGSANPIGGRNAIIKLRWGADAMELLVDGAPGSLKFALGENVKRDRDPDRYPASRMGVMDVIRQAFLDARAYQAEWDAYNDRGRRDRDAVPPRRDLKLETIADVLSGETLMHIHSYRADEILQVLRVAGEFDVRNGTLHHVLEGYKVADEIAEAGFGGSTFSDWWAYKVEAYDAIPHNAAIMARRGVVVSVNSDSDEEMRHLNQEAAKTMKWGGLSEDEAMRLFTINPAIQLGIQDRVGSIEVGKDADLAVFTAHPLTMDAVVQQTYLDGKLYFDRDLDRERQRAIAQEKAALMEKLMPDREGAAGTITEDMIAIPGQEEAR